VRGLRQSSSAGRGQDGPRGPVILARLAWLAYLSTFGLMVGALVAASLFTADAATHYFDVLQVPSFREALIRTHLVAGISSAIVFLLGIIFLFGWRLRSGPGLTVLLRAPLLMHGFPAALAYLILFGNAGWVNRFLQQLLGLSQPPLPLAFTPQALVLFFVIFGLPYFLAYTVHAVDADVAELEDAARLLGCGPGDAFRRVTLPLLRTPVKAGLSLVYIMAAGSLSVPMVIGGARNALLTAEIYGLIASFADLPGAATLSIGLILSLLPPLLLIDRLVEWAIDRLSRVEPPRRASGSAAKGTPRTASSGQLVVRLLLGYQSLWLAIFGLLVCTPLLASFVLDWGAGVLPRSWTLQWYREISPQFWESIRLSLLLSLGCVLLTFLAGLPLAVAWRFGPIPGRNALKTLVLLPVGIPGFLWGLSLLSIAYRFWPPFAQSPWILLAGQSFLALPFMLRVLMSALEQFDPGYLEVAACLGAGSFGRIWRVLLPMLLPSMGVGAALVFVRSFGESNLTLMVAPTGYPTAPIWLYQAIGSSGIGFASVLELFLVAVPLAALIGWESWLRRQAPWAAARAALPVA
jgi:ABC-type Fe3+ transport system permease subunit